jgi:hypothetical protein
MKVSRMTKIADVYYCLIYLITRMLKQKKKIKQKIAGAMMRVRER